MAQTIDFYIDATNGQLVASGSGSSGALPSFTRNDVYKFRVRIQERDSNNLLRDIDTTGTAVKIGVGGIDSRPTEGAFKLVLNSVTSSAITYSSTAATLALNIYNAVSNNVSTVNQFGSENDAFILTATGTNTALSFGGDSFTLFPLSAVLISTRRNQAPNVQSQQILKLRRNPAVYADNFTQSSTAGIVTLTKLQDGGTNKNETYKLSIGRDAEAGGVVLQFGSNSTTGIPVGANATSFTEALSAVTGIGANNISVDSGNNFGDYTITFVRELGNVDVTTALTLDASNVIFANFLESTVTFATAELDELFSETSTATITPTLEIEITQGSQPKTIFQGSISVRKDLITTGSAIPAAQASYYTKAEVDAAFVEDLATGAAGSVNAANRKLNDSTGADSLAWNTRKLLKSSQEYLSWDGGLGFYGSTAVSKQSGSNLINSISATGLLSYSTPTQANVINNLVSAGVLSSSATYGVFPSSIKTLTTTESVWFGGSIAANDTHSISVTVTGASLNDIILFGLPSAVSAGLTFQGCVVTANVVSITAQNGTNSAQNQATGTFRITVIGY